MGITFGLITDVLPVSLQSPAAWAQQIYFPASAVSTLLYVGFLLAWVNYSYNKRCANGKEAQQTITIWLSLLGMAIVSNIIVLVLFIQFTIVQAPATQAALGGASFVNAPPYEFLIPLTLVNGLLLFWLPTCFLSQRTLRFIPPMSYELNTFTEKR
ncbi:hypothetical protein [Cyanobium sp. HWJ4-Hawea]|uniref:hypothetical protein n=1 Tax=Cyanobium sp. HWJ4-Hawea TaxID=2823713 RepID=UPI0020CC3D68|nr:hypothetical protein [Cyanobium sp. HWJ4-Hawea]